MNKRNRLSLLLDFSEPLYSYWLFYMFDCISGINSLSSFAFTIVHLPLTELSWSSFTSFLKMCHNLSSLKLHFYQVRSVNDIALELLGHSISSMGSLKNLDLCLSDLRDIGDDLLLNFGERILKNQSLEDINLVISNSCLSGLTVNGGDSFKVSFQNEKRKLISKIAFGEYRGEGMYLHKFKFSETAFHV